MRALALVLALLSVPAFAADHTPWPAADRADVAEPIELAQRGKACCKHCTKGQPCGDSCISTKKKCTTPPGCAC